MESSSLEQHLEQLLSVLDTKLALGSHGGVPGGMISIQPCIVLVGVCMCKRLT